MSAEKCKTKGYIGRIQNAGTQFVEAPHLIKPQKGPSVKKGTDLRCGKSK